MVLTLANRVLDVVQKKTNHLPCLDRSWVYQPRVRHAIFICHITLVHLGLDPSCEPLPHRHLKQAPTRQHRPALLQAAEILFFGFCFLVLQMGMRHVAMIPPAIDTLEAFQVLRGGPFPSSSSPPVPTSSPPVPTSLTRRCLQPGVGHGRAILLALTRGFIGLANSTHPGQGPTFEGPSSPLLGLDHPAEGQRPLDDPRGVGR